MGWETPAFKANVRNLKRLGLTQSLETGYRLTALGEQVAALVNERRAVPLVQKSRSTNLG